MRHTGPQWCILRQQLFAGHLDEVQIFDYAVSPNMLAIDATVQASK